MAGAGGPVFDDVRRLELAGAFQEGGEHYDKVRPGYPGESLAWLAAGLDVRDALDVGAGTGKYTHLLAARGWRVSAVDPSGDMLVQLRRNLPGVAVRQGTAEDTGLGAASIDLAVAAQAWHWCDPLAASTEMARVLRPGGVLGLVWNQLDVSVPWVHRLSRIMHAGDVHKPGFRPHVGPEFHGLSVHGTRWEQAVTPEELLELAKSRSYYLKADAAIRAKVLGNLRWYLFEHLGHTPGQELALPYFCQTWRAHTQQRLRDVPSTPGPWPR
ncbi:class I SAM-dependent methyltransferase [Arthrobacter sp. STN4]|uniref:class I SAM-dependent methyltransferase n=1 Tax=Arthrobacter sp. STN4 TaxID=2923276 RepID=UPI00211A5C38|nr:class I SAM-dependent methyltransferase [Arthrobacter sp. STN4]MCQ9162905.1 class I SAM-dependent methyltransferase [Arthrobacter sp. STN4]